MTSQLTPERTTTSPSHQAEESRELPIVIQPWFLLAVLCVIAMVLLVAFG